MAYLAKIGSTTDHNSEKARADYIIGWGSITRPALTLPAADHGFTVTRRYEAIENPKDVTMPMETESLQVRRFVHYGRTNAALSRRIGRSSTGRLRAHQPEPSPERVQRNAPTVQRSITPFGRWNPIWFEHQNLRDERAEAFASSFGAECISTSTSLEQRHLVLCRAPRRRKKCITRKPSGEAHAVIIQ